MRVVALGNVMIWSDDADHRYNIQAVYTDGARKIAKSALAYESFEEFRGNHQTCTYGAVALLAGAT